MVQGQERPITGRKIRQLESRIYHVARFDRETFRELKEDKNATGQAVAVLLLVGLSYGLGFSIFNGLQKSTLSPNFVISQTLANMIVTDFAIFVWSATVFLVGTKLFQGKTNYWELARPLFFAASPFLLFLLIIVPIPPVIIQGRVPIYWFQGTVAVVAVIWLFLSQVFALKQVMGLSLRRTVLTVAVGLLILAFIGIQFGTA